MRSFSPTALFSTWALHDIEEVFSFPAMTEMLAELTGIDSLRMNLRQSAIAVASMGLVVGAACLKGAQTNGSSHFYRATLAGLDAHIFTHVGASLILRRYAAGVATAAPVMGSGTWLAKRELKRAGITLGPADYARGACLLIPTVIACQAFARALPSKTSH